MKKLSLDLGIGSIGYAYIDTEKQEIIEANSIIIPTKGNAETGASAAYERRQFRSARRNNQRRQERNSRLELIFEILNCKRGKSIDKNILQEFSLFMGNHKFANSPEHAIWYLRKKATEQIISLDDLAKVIYHISQNRGFNYEINNKKLSKTKESEYNDNKEKFNNYFKKSKFISDYALEQIKKQTNQEKRGENKIKGRIIHECHYINELQTILDKQSEHYSFLKINGSDELKKITSILYKNNIEHRNMRNKSNLTDFIINDVIFYRRPLKSQKNLRGKCTLVKFKDNKGREMYKPVCNKKNPKFQEFKIWKNINDYFADIDLSKKQEIFNYLNCDIIIENINKELKDFKNLGSNEL